MSALISAEFLKLRTTRTFWLVSLLALALVALFTVAQLASGSTISTESDARSLLSQMGTPGFLLMVLGVVGAAGEYRHGTITSTFLVAPDRRRVLVAKAIAYGISAIGVALLSALIVIAISAPWLSGDGHSLSSLGIDAGALAGIVAGAIAYIAISAMLGVGIGALFTNQVAAVVVVLLFPLLVDPALSALIDGYGRFGLSGLGLALSGSTGDDSGGGLFSPLAAAAIYLGYAAVILAAAAEVSTRRDVA